MDASRHERMSRLMVAVAAAVVAGTAVQKASAASATWSSTAATGNWETGANWGGAAPGSTTVTNNTDIATFNSASTTTAIIVDANRNLRTITFDANAAAYTIGATDGNALRLSSGSAISMTSTVANSQTINAPLTLYGTSTVTNSSTTKSLTLGGTITTAAASGTTLLDLRGPGAASGPMVVTGNINDGGNAKLTVSVRGTNTDSASAWVLSGNNNFSGSLTLNGAGTSATAGSVQLRGTATVQNSSGLAITNQAPGARVDLRSDTDSTFFGSATGHSSLSRWVLNVDPLDTASYSGSARTITLNGSHTFGGTNASFTVSSSEGFSAVVGGLTLSGSNQAFVASTGTTIASVGFDSVGGTVTGRNLTVRGAGAGSVGALDLGTGTLTKSEAGSWTLTGTNTYTGATTINAGTLVVDGTLASASAVTVAAGATLRGTGTIGGATTINGSGASKGAINPVDSLTINNTLTLTLNAVSLFDLASPASHSRIDGLTGLTYAGTLTIQGTGLTAGVYDLFDWGMSVTPTGTFASISAMPALGEGLSWRNYGSEQSPVYFDYATGQVQVIPEPAVSLLAFGASGGLLLGRRRQRR